MELLQAKTTTSIPEERLRRAKWEANLPHAELKATTEVVNKTKGDAEHTFVMTEHIDEFTVILWAQNMNNPEGKTIFSRSYLIALQCTAAE